MGSLPNLIKKPQILEHFVPSFPSCEPLVFRYEPFGLIFMRNHVFQSSPSTNNPSYIKWLDMVQQKKEKLLKYQGIFDLIQLSRVGPRYNPHLLVVAIYFWESTTNTFPLPCGMITPTIFDIAAIVGLRPNQGKLWPRRIKKTKPNFTFAHPSYNTYIKDHYASTDNVSAQEHIPFLTCWLSHYVLCSNSLQVAKKFIPLATQLYERRNVSLNKLI